MKRYRPYKTFPDDIVGKAVMVNTGQVTLVYHLDTAKKLIQTTVKGYSCISAFEELTFADGTPCGELYEEVVELEHDKVYLVRGKETAWQPRHFAKRDGNSYFFYNEGQSSKTVPSEEISVSRWHQVREYEKKYVRSYTTFDESEYLIKQS